MKQLNIFNFVKNKKNVGKINWSQEIGKKYFKWTIKNILSQKNTYLKLALVICDCGKEYTKSYRSIRKGETKCKNCPIIIKRKPYKGRIPIICEEEIGKKYNCWTVISFCDQQDETNIYGISTKGSKRFLLECNCGYRTKGSLSEIRAGYSKMCRQCSHKRKTTHGYTTTINQDLVKRRLYRTWESMKQRCYNKKDKEKYFLYGARGIRVCDQWLNSFEQFIQDMGPKPSPSHQLDRIDVDGNYEPSNCRWATPQENTKNRRVSIENRDKYITIRKDQLTPEMLALLKINI